MIGIVDYGVGNLFSLKSSFAAIGVQAEILTSPSQLEKADKIILPGVGAFEDAVKKLKESGMADAVKAEVAKGKYLMGICLGMQLLFEKSYEYGEHEGLCLLKGSVVPFEGRISPALKIPHIGWNALTIKEHPLFKYIKNGDCVYFVHSYYAADCDCVLATAEYDIDVTAAVGKANVLGCQFHPEKSGDVGLKILKAFVELR